VSITDLSLFDQRFDTSERSRVLYMLRETSLLDELNENDGTREGGNFTKKSSSLDPRYSA